MGFQKKNILFISARSDMGGGPRHMLDLITEIKKSYPEINIFSASPSTLPFGPQFKNLSFKHIKIKPRSFSLISYFRLLDLCKTNNISTIHSHGRGAGIYSRLLGLFNIKVVHTFHGAHSATNLLGKIKLFLDQFLAPLTDKFICVSKSEKEKALTLSIAIEGKTSIIPNGIDIEAINKIPALNLHDIYNIPPETKIWGSLTRLSYEKGNDLLLEALSQSPNLSNHIFLVAGDGPDRENLEQEKEKLGLKNVLFIGQIDNPIGFLKGLDGYFSFSRGEGLPYAVLEALACHTPCLLSNVTGHRNLVQTPFLFDLTKLKYFPEKLKAINSAQKVELKDEYTLKNMIQSNYKILVQ